MNYFNKQYLEKYLSILKLNRIDFFLSKKDSFLSKQISNQQIYSNDSESLTPFSSPNKINSARILADKAQDLNYKKKIDDVFWENESNHVFIGYFHDEYKIEPNPDEIMEYKWENFNQIIEDIKNNSQSYTAWFSDVFNLVKTGLKEYDLAI